MADVFLSYNREDQVTAQRFAEGFKREGFSVWWDQTLNPGEQYDHITEKALKEARAVVVLWSKKSVESRWVRAEATLADRNKTLVPVMIEPCDRPIMFELTHTADLSQWKGDPKDGNWQAFLTGVRRFVHKEAAPPSPAVVAPAATSGSRRNVWMGVAAAALVIAFVAAWIATRAPRPTPPVTVANTAAPAVGAVTLAVLPFADMSTAHDQEAFSDGLTEEILNQLAQIKAMRVTGRTSSFSFKGRNEDLRSIADKLDVGNLLEGSIRKDGKQLRITAQLINGKDGSHLWSQTYDRELSGVFALQEEIAKDVAKALSIKLDVGDMPRTQGGTTNLEAYDKYLLARTLYFKDDQENFQEVARLCREAVALDPDFTRAWYNLYLALSNLGASDEELAPVRMRLEALAPESWWTNIVRSNALLKQGKWTEAEAASRTALAAAPLEKDAAVFRGYQLMNVGRISEALPYQRQAVKMDPLSNIDSGFLQLMLDEAGNPDEAQAEYIRSGDLAGGHSSTDRDALFRLMYRKPVDRDSLTAQFRKVLKYDMPDRPLHQMMFDKRFDLAGARAALHRAFEDPTGTLKFSTITIMIYADHLGDQNLALAALRSAYVDQHFRSPIPLWLPLTTNLRAEPTFKDVVRELGLVDYWRATGNWSDFCKPIGKDDFECH